LTKNTLAGVIAEYNPFHNGHLYHMRKAKEITGSSAVAVVLSSHFVQRGEPSFIDKWARAQMALAGGADLVLELPAVFACHNAGVFASAAVDILYATGIVTQLVFGMENPQAPLAEAADTLNGEDNAMRERLKESLSRGFSYVESRSKAVGAAKPHLAELLKQPNNSLAVAYVQRIRGMGYNVEPVPIGRLGEGYHSEKPETMASATMIRKAFRNGDAETAQGAMPQFASGLVKREMERGRCIVSLDTYWRMARSFLALNRRSAERSAEMSEGFHNRLADAAVRSANWEDLVERCVSRRYPRGRVQRHIAHCLFGLDHWTNRGLQRLGPPYIRVLGWNTKGKKMLATMRKTALLPVIYRPFGHPGSYAKTVADYEFRVSHLWETLVPSPQPRKEALEPPVMLY